MINKTKQVLRWGILGCANIALRAMIPGIQASASGQVRAIASRNLEKAQKTAFQFDIPFSYGGYEELIDNDSIDAVYIPLPNHMHKEWTIRAAKAGKHVLCEKPIALNATEAEEMVEASNQANIQLVEAFMYCHHPRYKRVKELIDSGVIGTIRSMYANFTFNNAADQGNFRFDQAMGGGSLYDIGCYPIHAARFLLEDEPEAATAYAFFSPEHDCVDMMASGLLEFPRGIGVTFDCGMWAQARNTIELLGTEGSIRLPSAFSAQNPEEESQLEITIGNETKKEYVKGLNPYTIQVDKFANSLWNRESLHNNSNDCIKNMHVLDGCLQSSKQQKRIPLK